MKGYLEDQGKGAAIPKPKPAAKKKPVVKKKAAPKKASKK